MQDGGYMVALDTKEGMHIKLMPGSEMLLLLPSVYLLLGFWQDQPPQHDDLSGPETPRKGP